MAAVKKKCKRTLLTVIHRDHERSNPGQTCSVSFTAVCPMPRIEKVPRKRLSRNEGMNEQMNTGNNNQTEFFKGT